jgi:hypothetical protein
MQNSSVSSVVMLMSSAWGPAPANSRLQAGHAQLGSGDGNPMTNGTAGAPGQSGHRGARRRLTSRPGRQALALS